MNYENRRNQVLESMEDGSLLLLYSGEAIHTGADAYYPFEANKNFFYLTGLRRENMVLLMTKVANETKSILYIEEADPTQERWTGKMVTAEEALELTKVDEVRYIARMAREINMTCMTGKYQQAYFDLYRYSSTDLPDYNVVKAEEFAKLYSGIQQKNVWPAIARLRMTKDADEAEAERVAVDVTRQGLEHVMKNLKPGKKEYQAQADFEYKIFDLGADGPSFQTIAGSGKNGTMLHYETNRDTCEDGTLLLLDLGARVNGYCADITRTYPVNGKFTERQRAVYEIVLKANRRVAEEAKPGMTLRQLNDICKEELAKGCKELGLIKEDSELFTYYMHGVSHHLGIDVHDVNSGSPELMPGCVITDEPGLYIDEWEIGIRIEDDLLITEDGCEVLSKDIIRDPDEIEAFMAK